MERCQQAATLIIRHGFELKAPLLTQPFMCSQARLIIPDSWNDGGDVQSGRGLQRFHRQGPLLPHLGEEEEEEEGGRVRVHRCREALQRFSPPPGPTPAPSAAQATRESSM